MILTTTVIVLLLCLVPGEIQAVGADPPTKSPLDGTWILDRSRDVGSMLQLLTAMGVDFFTRRVVASLEITDRYTVNRTDFVVVRNTSYTDAEYFYRVNVPEELNDQLLGAVHSMVRVNDDLSRVTMTMVRASDEALFVGTRHVAARTDPRLLIYTMNFTKPGATRSDSCVRYFVKQ